MLHNKQINDMNDREKDIYVLLDSMATNIGKLFDTLDISVNKDEVDRKNYSNMLKYLFTNLLIDKSIISKITDLNEQIKKASEKAEEVKIDKFGFEQSYNILQDEYNNLQILLNEKNTEIVEIKDHRDRKIEELQTESINQIKTLIEFRDTLILRDGLIRSGNRDENPGIPDVKTLMRSLLKETADILERNNVHAYDQKGDFDKYIHVVKGTKSTSNKELDNTIAEVFRPGYKYGEEFIRLEEVILYVYNEK